MNKRERYLKQFYKFKKRLRNYGFTLADVKKPENNLFCFKSSGKPCSCYLCSHDKYKRAVKHKKKIED